MVNLVQLHYYIQNQKFLTISIMLNSNSVVDSLAPVLYMPHGGGPMPLLGDKDHVAMVNFLKSIPTTFKQPSAIVMVSAHWEASIPTITSGANPELIYDYHGFPEESYQIKYPAPGSPELAFTLGNMLGENNIQYTLDEQRGFDHGMFIPLKIMYPDADVPCIQLSLIDTLNAAEHIALGKSLARLREDNVLIIGSGLSFHNMGAFSDTSVESQKKCHEFDSWLIDTCTNQAHNQDHRESQLSNWENAPSARYCHPREEHLLPLQVCFGAAYTSSPAAKVVFNDDVLKKRATALLW